MICKRPVPVIRSEKPESRKPKNKNERLGTRDHSKSKRVCLLRAKSDNLKIKKKAILSRGGDYQVNRHKKSVHSSVPLAEVKSNIVPINHILVPKSIRAKALFPAVTPQEAQVKKPNVEITTGNDKSSSCSDDNNEEDNENEEIVTMGNIQFAE